MEAVWRDEMNLQWEGFLKQVGFKLEVKQLGSYG